MVKISNASYDNEIHRVDSYFNENSKNIIFAREALISGRDGPKIKGKCKQGNLLLCKLDSAQF